MSCKFAAPQLTFALALPATGAKIQDDSVDAKEQLRDKGDVEDVETDTGDESKVSEDGALDMHESLPRENILALGSLDETARGSGGREFPGDAGLVDSDAFDLTRAKDSVGLDMILLNLENDVFSLSGVVTSAKVGLERSHKNA